MRRSAATSSQGNGREWGEHGFRDFLETKAVMGYGAA
jgi:aldehyde dehydrogenase (NAD+)